MMDEIMNDFRAIGIAPTGDMGAVRKAFHAKAKELHPDRGGHSGNFIELRKSYGKIMECIAEGKMNNLDSNSIFVEVEYPLECLICGGKFMIAVPFGNDEKMLEFAIPPMTPPGSRLQFDILSGNRPMAVNVAVSMECDSFGLGDGGIPLARGRLGSAAAERIRNACGESGAASWSEGVSVHSRSDGRDGISISDNLILEFGSGGKSKAMRIEMKIEGD